MRSATRLRVALDRSGTTRAVELRAEAPQLVRITDPGGPGRPLVVHLVGGAAGPLAGDWSTLVLGVGPGCDLVLRSVAATLVQPGAAGTPSTARVDVEVGHGARLEWWPEPLVAVAGCDHELTCALDVAGDGWLRWADEIVCGRAGEIGGRLALDQRVTVDGSVVSHQQLAVGPHTTGPGWNGPSRVLVTAIEIGRHPDAIAPPIVTPRVRGARMSPQPGVTCWTALGADLDTVRAALVGLGLEPLPPLKS